MELQIGVKVLLRNSEGKYLLIKRSQPLLDGGGIRWDIPGGRVIQDETLDEALARELKEETDMNLSSQPAIIAAQDIIVPDKKTHIIRLTYAAKSSSHPKLSNEHKNHKWLSLNEILGTNIDDYLREVINRLIASGR